MKQYMQAKPRLDEIDLSFIDPRSLKTYAEKIESKAPNRFISEEVSDLGRSPTKAVIPRLFTRGDASSRYKTTVTPFGPILPTGFSLPAPDLKTFGEMHMSSSIIQPIDSLQKIVTPGNIAAGINLKSVQGVPFPTCNVAFKPSTSEMVRRILANESSSDSDEENCASNRMEFKEQATAIPSRVTSPSNPPAPIPKMEGESSRKALSPPLRAGLLRTPRSERIQKKREELEKVQEFLEQSRAVHEKIYSNFDVRRVNTRDPGSSTKRRSLSDYVSEASNVAELRRNIADQYSATGKREPSPLPPLGSVKNKLQQQKRMSIPRTTSAEREPGQSCKTAAVRTPSASSRSPKVASPDRLVSGVFVSYPRKKRSESAPPSDKEQQSPPVLRSQNKKGGKMTVDEYAELRKNLLNRSEQHAVSNN